MKLINLTPHAIHIFKGDTSVLELKATGLVARVRESIELDSSIAIPVVGIHESAPLSSSKEGLLACPNREDVTDLTLSVPVYHATSHHAEGLPMPETDVYYIVSKVVASLCPERKDLLVPQDLVRNEAGQILGCRGFASFCTDEEAM